MNLAKTNFFKKIIQEKNQIPLVLCADIDGTIFSAGWKIIKAPFYNLQTTQILQKKSVPLVLVTGRQTWNHVVEKELPVHGLNIPDIAIAGAGTEIFYNVNNKHLEKDLLWRQQLLNTQVTWKIPKTKPTTLQWDKHQITEFLKQFRIANKVKLKITKGNALLLRLIAEDMPINQLDDCIDKLKSIWIKGISIQISEKLLKTNTTDIFNGDILIMPEGAGKDKALQYVLTNYSKETNKKLHAYIFGDATIDIPMLTMEENKYYDLSQFGVNLTALARHTLEKVKNERLTLTQSEGPQTILKTITSVISNEVRNPRHLSSAQNNPSRNVVKHFEPLLNNILDKKLSANDISLLGLDHVKKGITNINSDNVINKLRGLGQYLFGNATDVLDGIRARNNLRHSRPDRESIQVPNTIPGQLVDGFCDRAKEFYQLYERGKKGLSFRTPCLPAGRK